MEQQRSRAPAKAAAAKNAEAIAARKAEAARKKKEVEERKAEAARKRKEKEEEKKKKAVAVAARKEEAAQKKKRNEEEKKKKEAAAAARKAEAARKKEEKEAAAAKKKAEREEAKKKKLDEAAKKKAEAAATVKPKQWQHSKARKMLKKDIEDGAITLDAYDAQNNPNGTKDEDAFLTRPAFQPCGQEKFSEYLSSMRQSISDAKSRAGRDAEAVAQFRTMKPPPTHNHRGEPRWEGSKAEAMLKKDMDDGIHLKAKKPSHMRFVNPEYQKYNSKTFTSHVDQETRARKFKVYLDDKNKQKQKELGKK